jgi:hypothetical protein
LLEKYLKAPDFDTRIMTVAWIGTILHRTQDASTQESAISLLLTVAETDREGGLDDHAAKVLTALPGKAFNTEARSRVGKLLTRKEPPREIVLLAGVIGDSAFDTRLRALASHYNESSPPRYGSNDWAAQLALARLGDAPSIEHVIKRLDAANDENDLIRMFPDLGYIRQPEAVALLKKFLFSDARLRPTNPGMPGGRIAGYAVYELAKMLEGFPVKIEESKGYGESEIAKARAWMNANPKPTILR